MRIHILELLLAVGCTAQTRPPFDWTPYETAATAACKIEGDFPPDMHMFVVTRNPSNVVRHMYNNFRGTTTANFQKFPISPDPIEVKPTSLLCFVDAGEKNVTRVDDYSTLTNGSANSTYNYNSLDGIYPQGITDGFKQPMYHAHHAALNPAYHVEPAVPVFLTQARNTGFATSYTRCIYGPFVQHPYCADISKVGCLGNSSTAVWTEGFDYTSVPSTDPSYCITLVAAPLTVAPTAAPVTAPPVTTTQPVDPFETAANQYCGSNGFQKRILAQTHAFVLDVDRGFIRHLYTQGGIEFPGVPPAWDYPSGVPDKDGLPEIIVDEASRLCYLVIDESSKVYHVYDTVLDKDNATLSGAPYDYALGMGAPVGSTFQSLGYATRPAYDQGSVVYTDPNYHKFTRAFAMSENPYCSNPPCDGVSATGSFTATAMSYTSAPCANNPLCVTVVRAPPPAPPTPEQAFGDFCGGKTGVQEDTHAFYYVDGVVHYWYFDSTGGSAVSPIPAVIDITPDSNLCYLAYNQDTFLVYNELLATQSNVVETFPYNHDATTTQLQGVQVFGQKGWRWGPMQPTKPLLLLDNPDTPLHRVVFADDQAAVCSPPTGSCQPCLDVSNCANGYTQEFNASLHDTEAYCSAGKCVTVRIVYTPPECLGTHATSEAYIAAFDAGRVKPTTAAPTKATDPPKRRRAPGPVTDAPQSLDSQMVYWTNRDTGMWRPFVPNFPILVSDNATICYHVEGSFPLIVDFREDMGDIVSEVYVFDNATQQPHDTEIRQTVGTHEPFNFVLEDFRQPKHIRKFFSLEQPVSGCASGNCANYTTFLARYVGLEIPCDALDAKSPCFSAYKEYRYPDDINVPICEGTPSATDAHLFFSCVECDDVLEYWHSSDGGVTWNKSPQVPPVALVDNTSSVCYATYDARLIRDIVLNTTEPTGINPEWTLFAAEFDYAPYSVCNGVSGYNCQTINSHQAPRILFNIYPQPNLKRGVDPPRTLLGQVPSEAVTHRRVFFNEAAWCTSDNPGEICPEGTLPSIPGLTDLQEISCLPNQPACATLMKRSETHAPTAAPTTTAPTTAAPVTFAPTTGAPTTGAPTTGAPTFAPTLAPTVERQISSIFMTSRKYHGDFAAGGANARAVADAICMRHAEEAGLIQQFHAIIGTGDGKTVHDLIPYNTDFKDMWDDENPIATSPEELIDVLYARTTPLPNEREKKPPNHNRDATTWTGFSMNTDNTIGGVEASNCNGWTSDSAADMGYIGNLHQTGTGVNTWIMDAESPCAQAHFIYCIDPIAPRKDTVAKGFKTATIVLGSVVGVLLLVVVVCVWYNIKSSSVKYAPLESVRMTSAKYQ